MSSATCKLERGDCAGLHATDGHATTTTSTETGSSSGNSSPMNALDELQELLEADPDAERVSLRGRGLSQEAVESALEFLQTHFPRLRHLDLRGNGLSELPRDFGKRMPRLVALDLSHNRFRFRLGALRALAETLQQCPCLRSLSLSLESPAEEQLLLAMLPGLRILNGTPLSSNKPSVSEQGLPPSPTLQELQLFCASPSAKTPKTPRTTSPQAKRDLRLQYAALKTDNPSEGAIKRPIAVPKAKSKTLVPKHNTKNSVRPTDQPVSISDDRTDWCKLLKLNPWQPSNSAAVSTIDSSSKVAKAAQAAAVSTETFLSQLKTIVKAFHECDAASSSLSDKSTKAKLFTQLDHHVDLLAQQLTRQEEKDGSALSEGMLQARWSLLEVCALFGSQKAAQTDAALGGGFELLLEMQKQVLTAMQTQQRKPKTLSGDSMKGSSQMQGEQESQSQLKLLLDVAEGLENDLEVAQLKLQQETIRRELVEQENWVLKRERDCGAGNSTSSTVTTVSNTVTPASRRIRRRKDECEGSNTTKSSRENDVRPPEVSAVSPPAVPVVATVSVRSLSLKQLVDLINCVYASKTKYDARATTAGAPRETMEQHLYTYLNTRFGLPKLIVDYASAVWKAAERFAQRENDAAVFVALLRNRLDEGFLDIKRKLQRALVELLRAFFTARYPLKQGKAVAALVQHRIDNILHEEEWRNLLTYLYEPQDSSTLVRLVRAKAEKYQSQRLKSRGEKPTKGAVKAGLALPFVEFEQVLYGYQLQGRLDLLDGFRGAFEELDDDRVGIISRDSFATLVRRLAPTKSESTVTKLVETLDPFKHDVITFSDAASALLPDIRRANTKTAATRAKSATGNRRVTIAAQASNPH